MDLPKRERTFYFNYVGESGFKYEGQFTVLCRLNMAEKYAQELEKTRLTDGVATPSNGLAGIATVISYLRTRIVDAPEWWKQGRGLGMEDEDALVTLYDKVAEESNAWRTELATKANKAAEQLGKQTPT